MLAPLNQQKCISSKAYFANIKWMDACLSECSVWTSKHIPLLAASKAHFVNAS